MQNRYIQTVLIAIGALSFYWFKYVYAYLIFGTERYNTIPTSTRQWLITLSVVVTCLLITAIIASFNIKRAIELLGLNKKILPALIATGICTIPMFTAGALYSGPSEDITIYRITDTALWPGFNEELIFRGFIVGLLVRCARWHIAPAIIVSAIIFAWGHLYQADNAVQAVIVFFVASGAGIGFAIFYKMWHWNLWFPICMHILMNLSFVIYDTGDSILLGRTANIARGITIALAIAISIYVNYSPHGRRLSGYAE